MIGKALGRQARSSFPLSLEEWASFFTFGGVGYPFGLMQQTLGESQEQIGTDFRALVHGAYKRDGVVFACMLVRMLLFSEARFAFRRLRNGRPGDLFGTADLASLERPWPGATTGDLLARAIQDVDLCGNFFAAWRPGGQIRRLRPDWVTIVLGSDSAEPLMDPDVQVAGYAYTPGGAGSGASPEILRTETVAHFAPIPDPESPFRGMTWLHPIVTEIMGDLAASQHKLRFFEKGATPNLVVQLDPSVNRNAFEDWVEAFRAGHEGLANAYKTLFLGGGAKATVVGANLRQLDFKATQGAGETRIAAAAGVPPVLVGLSEGLQAATYSNYGQARRRFADGTMRPLWRNLCGSLAPIIRVPGGAELWYDDSDIAFLQEDAKDDADIVATQAQSIRQLTDGGYLPESVIAAVTAGDLTLLQHSGLTSVQLVPPSTNGKGSEPALAPSAN
jgi:hypothetical protein